MNTYPKTHTILSSKAYTNWKIYLSSTAPVWNSEIKSQTQMMNFELLMVKISLISEKTFVFLCIMIHLRKNSQIEFGNLVKSIKKYDCH